jgi:tetratricopeptide (TPR) repeat protein
MSLLTTTDNLASLPDQLAQLEQHGLIRLAAAQPELAYLFRHALLQESAYSSLLRANRRLIHRAAGQALEEALGGQPPTPELTLQLAHHFEEAGDAPRALNYYAQAGDAALALYANAEAIAAYTRALACAERAPCPLETWQHLYGSRGRALELNSEFEAALANYQAMAQRGQELGQRRLALAAAVASAQLFATATPLFDPPEAERMSDEALAEARALGDSATEAKILWNQLNLYRFTQRLPQARVCGEASLAISRRLGLTEQAALNLNDLIHVYADQGLWALADEAAAEASHLWRELDNAAMLADSLTTTSLYSSLQGHFAEALRLARESHQQSVAIGNVWGQSYSYSAMSYPLWYTAQVDLALEAGESCLRLGRQAGYLVAEAFDQARLAQMYVELGAPDRARPLLDNAQAAARYVGYVGLATILTVRIHLALQSGQPAAAAALLATLEEARQEPPIWEVDAVLRSRSVVALAQADSARALAVTQAHVARVREMDLVVYLPEALLLLAQALQRSGQEQAARACLLEAGELVERLGMPMVGWMVWVALGNFEARHAQPAPAAAARQRARDIVTAIVARLPTPELQAAFAARREVRALLHDQPPLAARSAVPPAA